MSVTLNTGVSPPAGPRPAAEDQVNTAPAQTKAPAGVRQQDLIGATGAGGPAVNPFTAGGAPALPAPNVSAADMMIQLTGLMSKVAEMTTITQEETLKKDQTDLKHTQEKRMAEMKVYYEKMEESKELKTGFFARIVRAAGSALKGDWGQVGDQLGHAFAGNTGTAITLVIAVVGMGTPVGVVAGVFLLTSFLEDEACIYEMLRFPYELAGIDLDHETHEKFQQIAGVFKWVGVGIKIGVGVGVGVVSGVAALALAAPTGGTSMIVIPLIVGSIMAAGSAGIMVESTVRGSQATLVQGEGWEKGAQADMNKAQTELIMGRMKSNMTHLQDVFDTLQNLTSSVGNTIRQQQAAGASAAQAI